MPLARGDHTLWFHFFPRIKKASSAFDNLFCAVQPGKNANALIAACPDPNIAPDNLFIRPNDVNEITLHVALHRRIWQQGRLNRTAVNFD